MAQCWTCSCLNICLIFSLRNCLLRLLTLRGMPVSIQGRYIYNACVYVTCPECFCAAVLASTIVDRFGSCQILCHLRESLAGCGCLIQIHVKSKSWRVKSRKEQMGLERGTREEAITSKKHRVWTMVNSFFWGHFHAAHRDKYLRCVNGWQVPFKTEGYRQPQIHAFPFKLRKI